MSYFHVACKEFATNSLKRFRSSELFELSSKKKKKALIPFCPKNVTDFIKSKDYGRVKIEDDGTQFVYRLQILTMTESKEELDQLKADGRLKLPSTSKSRKAVEKEDFANFKLIKEREDTEKAKAEQNKLRKIGKELAQQTLLARLEKNKQEAESNTTLGLNPPLKCNEALVDSEAEEENTDKVETPHDNQRERGEDLPPLLSAEHEKTIQDDESMIDSNPHVEVNEAVSSKADDKAEDFQTNNESDLCVPTSGSKPEQCGPSNYTNLETKAPLLNYAQGNLPILSGVACRRPWNSVLTSKCSCCSDIKEELRVMKEQLDRIEVHLMQRALQYPDKDREEAATPAPDGFVDLGNNFFMESKKVERLEGERESLQTKVSLILYSMFSKDELKNFYLTLDKRAKTNPQAKLFPPDCIEKVEKAINEANVSIERKKVLRKQPNHKLSADNIKETMEYVDTVVATKVQDIDLKELRRAFSHVLYEARHEPKPKKLPTDSSTSTRVEQVEQDGENTKADNIPDEATQNFLQQIGEEELSTQPSKKRKLDEDAPQDGYNSDF